MQDETQAAPDKHISLPTQASAAHDSALPGFLDSKTEDVAAESAKSSQVKTLGEPQRSRRAE